MNLRVTSLFVYLLVAIGIVFNLISPPVALLTGMAFGLLGVFQGLNQSSGSLQKILLKASVIGLGFGIGYREAIEVGSQSFLISFLTIVCTFIVAFGASRFLTTENKLTMLIASGTAICGGSAIAAVSPGIKANNSQTSIALAIVFLLNAIALVIFPYIGRMLELSQMQFGLWCALAIHDTSSVVGASEAFGPESLIIATTTKLVRTLWIIPLLIVISFVFKTKGKLEFPWFILGFVAAILLSSNIPLVAQHSDIIVLIARKLLVFTLFLVGLQITVQKIRELGIKSLLIGVLAWISLAMLSLVYILVYV